MLRRHNDRWIDKAPDVLRAIGAAHAALLLWADFAVPEDQEGQDEWRRRRIATYGALETARGVFDAWVDLPRPQWPTGGRRGELSAFLMMTYRSMLAGLYDEYICRVVVMFTKDAELARFSGTGVNAGEAWFNACLPVLEQASSGIMPHGSDLTNWVSAAGERIEAFQARSKRLGPEANRLVGWTG